MNRAACVIRSLYTTKGNKEGANILYMNFEVVYFE